jgi:hypothetical protein
MKILLEGDGDSNKTNTASNTRLRLTTQVGQAHVVGVLTGNILRGVPEVDECGLAETGNSKEETRGTQFRQVRAARCVTPYVLYAT